MHALCTFLYDRSLSNLNIAPVIHPERSQPKQRRLLPVPITPSLQSNKSRLVLPLLVQLINKPILILLASASASASTMSRGSAAATAATPRKRRGRRGLADAVVAAGVEGAVEVRQAQVAREGRGEDCEGILFLGDGGEVSEAVGGRSFWTKGKDGYVVKGCFFFFFLFGGMDGFGGGGGNMIVYRTRRERAIAYSLEFVPGERILRRGAQLSSVAATGCSILGFPSGYISSILILIFKNAIPPRPSHLPISPPPPTASDQ